MPFEEFESLKFNTLLKCMEKKYFVEECFELTPRDVGNRIDCIRKLGINILENRPEIRYWFDDDDRPMYLFISVEGNEPQKLRWEQVEITFGLREYFYCQCGQRSAKLYLLPNGTEFQCRICHKLRYRLTSFNRNSIAGKTIYKMDRLHKLANDRASMSRIFYNGEYTKRFKRFLKLCDRAGLDSIVKGANDLKALIHG
jgi:hypothetical protein